MDPTSLASILVAVLGASGGVVIAVVRNGSRTRDRIDSLRREVAGQLDAVKAEVAATKLTVAALGQRVGTIPTSVVDEADCRERHEEIAERVSALEAARVAARR